jgi:ADP-heptose:LPS heptosyltransferase
MKILAVKTRALGDTVLWTAALEALLELPGAEVAIVYPENYQALFEKDPRFFEQYPLRQNTRANRELLQKIRTTPFDYALNFHASPSSRRFTERTYAKKILCHSHERGKAGPIPHQGVPMKATERDLNLVRAIGWSGKSPATKLIFPRGKKSGTKKKCVLAPGASRPAKQWPFDKWRELIRLLKQEFEPIVVIESLKIWNDRRFEVSEWSKEAQVVETPALHDLLLQLSLADVFVGSDSGAKHIACALGAATVTLFGPESIGEWHCYTGERHRALQVAVQCRDNDPNPPEFAWCGVTVCPYASHACLALIDPESVFNAITEVAKIPQPA